MVHSDRDSLGLDDPNLDKTFVSNVMDWVHELLNRNICVTLKNTYTAPADQAKLWKSGHSDAEIDRTIEYLENLGCGRMARYIRNAIAPIGPCLTTTLPGCSWNNWGVAMSYTLRMVNESKDLDLHDVLYKTTAPRVAAKCNLFTSIRIRPAHLKPNIIQAYKTALPTDIWSLQEINKKLEEGSL